MAEVFGNFIEIGETIEYLIISFSPSTLPIQERWRNNSLSADFLADYWGTFFPLHSGTSKSDQSEVRDSVSYIANELLENAVKFSYETAGHPIKISICLSDNALRFYVTNSIADASVRPFQDFIRELLTEDPYELYIRQLESNADEADDTVSRLGLLTLINDYDIDLAWKFETVRKETELMTVTTMAQMAILRKQ